MSINKKTVNVNMPLDLYFAARSYAGGEGLSLRAWIRKVVSEEIARRSESKG